MTLLRNPKTYRKQPVRLLLILFIAVLPLLCSSCKKKSAADIPRIQSDLLLEIYMEAGKNNYAGMLPKVERLRALDPSCVFLNELENITRNNLLQDKVNKLILVGDFKGALAAAREHERMHGTDKELSRLIVAITLYGELDSVIYSLNHSTGTDKFAKDLDSLEKLSKKMKFSKKMENFTRNKRSELVAARRQEKSQILFELWSLSREQREKGNYDFQVLDAVLSLEDRSLSPEWLLLDSLPAPAVRK